MGVFCAVIVAAGRGTRLGRPKQLLDLAGAPMIVWPVRVFAGMPEVAEIVIATEEEWIGDVFAAVSGSARGKRVDVIAGGATRQASVFAALEAVSDSSDSVFVHDGARPMIREEEVRSAMHPVRAGHASLLAVPVIDTVKVVDGARAIVERTLDRGSLWAAQTPQFAQLDDMRRAHEQGLRDGIRATDDAALLERIGVAVHVVHGSYDNFKVTIAGDLARAAEILQRRTAAAT